MSSTLHELQRKVPMDDVKFQKYSAIQVCTFHDGCKQGIDHQIFNRKSISR